MNAEIIKSCAANRDLSISVRGGGKYPCKMVVRKVSDQLMVVWEDDETHATPRAALEAGKAKLRSYINAPRISA